MAKPQLNAIRVHEAAIPDRQTRSGADARARNRADLLRPTTHAAADLSLAGCVFQPIVGGISA